MSINRAMQLATAGASGGAVIPSANALVSYDNWVSGSYNLRMAVLTRTPPTFSLISPEVNIGSGTTSVYGNVVYKENGVFSYFPPSSAGFDILGIFDSSGTGSWSNINTSSCGSMVESNAVSIAITNDGLTRYIHTRNNTTPTLSSVKKQTRANTYTGTWATESTKTGSHLNKQTASNSGRTNILPIDGATDELLMLCDGDYIYVYNFTTNTILSTYDLGTASMLNCSRSGKKVNNDFYFVGAVTQSSVQTTRVFKINLTTFSVTQTASLHSSSYDHYSPTMPAFDPAQNVIVSHRRDTSNSTPAFMMWSFDELTGSLTQIGSYPSASLGNRQVNYVGADETYIYCADWGGTDFLRFTKNSTAWTSYSYGSGTSYNEYAGLPLYIENPS